MNQPGRSAGAGVAGSRLAVVIGLSLTLALPACKKASTSPTPVTTTPSPTRAVVTISLLNLQLVVIDKPPFYWNLIYTLHVVESGGVGCTLNYVRLDVYEPSGKFLERTQLGPEAFTGGNRLEAGATRDFPVTNGFNSDAYPGRYLVISLGFTDDKGNNQAAVTGNLIIGG